MAILVTGGTGYIGSHTVVELIEKGKEVVILDNYSNSSPVVLNRIEKLVGLKPIFYEGDILDKNVLRRIFAENKIDDVIHFAGLKSVNESVRLPLKYYEDNVLGSLCLFKEMIRANIFSLIFSSSATVYGVPERIPLDEKCIVGGTTNPYGSSKLMIEKILFDLSLAYPEFQITILRYFNPAGAHPSGLIGEDPKNIPNNLLPYITQVAIGKLPELTVFGDDYPTFDGTGIRDYIHVMDLASGHISALEYQRKGNSFNVFNLGTGKGYSVLEIINAFEKNNNVKIPYSIAERRCGDVAECWSDPSLAKSILGWEAKKNIDHMVRDSWHWQLLNPLGYK